MADEIKEGSQFMVIINSDCKAVTLKQGMVLEIDTCEVDRLNKELETNPETPLIRNRQIITENEVKGKTILTVSLKDIYVPGKRYFAQMGPNNKVIIPVKNR